MPSLDRSFASVGLMIHTNVVWDQRFTAYDFGMGHPMHPIRLDLTAALCEEFGLFSAEGVGVSTPEFASDEQLSAVHTRALIDTVQRLSADPHGRGRNGVGTEDTPAFAGMHEISSLQVGGTIEAVRSVWQGQSVHAVNFAGGMHHAMADKSGGFCVYNDIAVGIQWLLDQGAKRVLYLDLDVHHGDGVESIFWNEPRVMTISLHETGAALYPGSGFPGDSGGRKAPGTAVNVALPSHTGDAGWLRAFQAVVPAMTEAFDPEIIVSQHGCDAHFSDPLATLSLSIDGMKQTYEWVDDLAHRFSAGKWVALGGGGYELVQVVPRAWAHTVAIAAHHPIAVDTALPPAWQERIRRDFEIEPPVAMGDRNGVPIEFGNWNEGYNPEDKVDSAVMATRQAIFPGWGLDPFFD